MSCVSQIDDISKFQLILVKYLCYLNLIFLAVCLLSSTKYVIYIIGILRILFFRFFANWKKLNENFYVKNRILKIALVIHHIVIPEAYLGPFQTSVVEFYILYKNNG